MKMGKTCVPPIRLRFGAKPAFDALAYPLQCCSGVAHRLVEHHELYPLLPKFMDLPQDLVNRSLAAIEDGTPLDCGSFDESHWHLLRLTPF
jgi:hypothetical protein